MDRLIDVFADRVEKNAYIAPELYDRYHIKRGLRNKNGTGVLVGITKIANVIGYTAKAGKKEPVEGDLKYRGYSVPQLIEKGMANDERIFEDISFLLLLGELPTAEEKIMYREILGENRVLPPGYLEKVLLALPGANIMNKMMRAVLSLYSFDRDPDNTSTANVLRQSVALIAKMPLIMTYTYQAKRHYVDEKSLIIHRPDPGDNTARTILRLLKGEDGYSEEDEALLDTLLVLHAEHGGGNNSAFATHVVSSSGTDTYSAIATALGSLKGPRHGGANLMVAAMLEDMKREVPDPEDRRGITDYVEKLLAKKAFDRSGLIYGLGHAVYTKSDPRARILRECGRRMAKEKHMEDDFQRIALLEEIGGKILSDRLNLSYPVPGNIDLYSGMIYEMLDIPKDLYTPLFALARTSGWCAHRLEQIMDKKIMRPAYVTLNDDNGVIPLRRSDEE